jgi:hypothetical protein
MNERILKLMTEAGFDVEKLRMYPGGWPREDLLILEDFAQLIVKECIGIVENLPSSYGDYRDQISNSTREACVEKIKQQFEIVEKKGWVCPKCGVDRIQAACPKGHTAALTGECPMVVTAQ